MKRAYERFLEYVVVHTTSDETTGLVPSTNRQFDLANMLVEELKQIGLEDALVDDKCYVYAHLKASEGFEDKPAIGFISHMDTSPDFSGEDVKPMVIDNYNGDVIRLGDTDRKLDPAIFPELNSMIGKKLICTDGNTLLGADDKSGIAEILTAVEGIINSDLPHGKICVAFTPDEEIGCGADFFDVDLFSADFAYTVDGGQVNEVEYENFNAASAEIVINGVSVHPGYAKDKMINAALVAMEFNELLPKEIPSNTEGYEGFYHLTDISGDVSKATLSYIIRDHDSEKFSIRKDTMVACVRKINEKYGDGIAEITVKEQYQNMIEMIRPHMHLIENAFSAIKECGGNPIAVPIRGGTDGARLSFIGLPCPNLGTGGYDFHGPFEHICAEDMDFVTEMIKNIIYAYAK